MRQGCGGNKSISLRATRLGVLKVLEFWTGLDLPPASFRELWPHLRLPRRIIKMLMKFACPRHLTHQFCFEVGLQEKLKEKEK